MSKAWIATKEYQGECRRNGNGAGKLIWTLAMSSCGVVFIGFMAWMTSLNGKVGTIEASMTLRGERLATLESVVQTVDKRLSRIEAKIDQLMERGVVSKGGGR